MQLVSIQHKKNIIISCRFQNGPRLVYSYNKESRHSNHCQPTKKSLEKYSKILWLYLKNEKHNTSKLNFINNIKFPSKITSRFKHMYINVHVPVNFTMKILDWNLNQPSQIEKHFLVDSRRHFLFWIKSIGWFPRMHNEFSQIDNGVWSFN